MFAFGYNFNYSYFANPFGCFNNFMPAMNFCGCGNYLSDLTTSLFLLNRLNNPSSNMMDSFSYSSQSSDQRIYNSLRAAQNSNNSIDTNNNNNLFNYSYNYTYSNNNFGTSFNSQVNYLNNLFTVTRPNLNVNTVKKSNKVKTNVSYNTKTNLPQFKDINYDKQKGTQLAEKVTRNVESRSTGWCARYVKQAIQNAGLGQYENGHAIECVDILKRNPNFKQVNVSGSQLSQLPAGCIIIYEPGAADYNPKVGHIEVTLGDGRAASDFINNRIKPSENTHVFVPVKS